MEEFILNKKTLLILIGIAVLIFPLDVSVILNRIFGFKIHTILFLVLLGIIFYNLPGKTLNEKWNKLVRMIKTVID